MEIHLRDHQIPGDIVIHLCDSLPSGNYFLYTDRFYTSLPMMQKLLREKQIHTIGTISANRLKSCPLKSDRELPQRGDSQLVVDANSNTSVLKWHDNKMVLLASNFVGSEPLSTCQRYCKAQKRRIEIQQPAMVKEYSKFMGGVDLFDMLKGLYTIDRRGYKFYYRFCHYLYGVCSINAWLLYRRHCSQRLEKFDDLLTFIGSIIRALQSVEEVNRLPGRPSVSVNPSAPQPPIKERRTSQQPQPDIRFDGVRHYPGSAERGRCRFCVTGHTTWLCQKCHVRLCLTKDKNCFLKYHEC